MFSNSFIVNFPTSARDPGPAAGNKPTDPMLVNGPVVDRNRLNQLFPPGAKVRNTGTIQLDNPDRVVGYTDQLSIGAQREITPQMSLNLDYVHAEGHDLLMVTDINPGTRATTSPSATVTRTNTAVYGNSAALLRVNTGKTTYDALEFQLDHHLGLAYLYRVSYTYSRARGNTSGNGAPQSNFQLLDDMNLDENEGPSDFDRPHNLVISGSWAVPHTHGLTLAMVSRYLSGQPFTIQDQNVDVNRNGILFDPLAAGKYGPNDLPRNATNGTPLPARNPFSVFNRGGRNGARGPDFFQTDVRIGYRIPVLTTRIELIGEAFNVFNRANFDTPSGDERVAIVNVKGVPTPSITNANYLNLNALRAGAIPRTIQFGAKFLF
jgi:hypothetical protein